METKLVNPAILKPNPWNSNRVTPANMEKLAKSITDLGFVSAVVVRELAGGELQILGGQHRVETAVSLGLREVPVLNLGFVPDGKAKKIGLVDNSRYGTDDTISLAKLYDEIGLNSEELASFLPFTEVDFDTISKSIEINLDELDLLGEDDAHEPLDRTPKTAKTHELLRFRVSLGDAERIRKLVEAMIRTQGLDGDDELTAAGSALALLLLSSED